MRDALTIICGDALTELQKLPAECVQCVCTSPPYWGLRDYGTAAWEGGDVACDHKEYVSPSRTDPVERYSTGGAYVFDSPDGHQYRNLCGKCGARRIDSQLGLEKTPEEYVRKMVEVFREVRRVLRRDGTLWLNLGDSYAGSMKGEGGTYELSAKQNSNRGSHYGKDNGEKHLFDHGLKPKDLCGIPWRVAFALQADGWWLRSDIIWAKPNPMPESVTDRPTKAHEYLFLLTKSATYFYDAEAIKEQTAISAEDFVPAKGQNSYRNNGSELQDFRMMTNSGGGQLGSPGSRNKRSVWTVATAPYPEAHFATYPPDLIKPCIMAGTSARGCCAKCGAPWERIIERGDVTATGGRGERYHDARLDGRELTTERLTMTAHEIKTLGWQPTCKCDAGIHPCVCLDPFVGSGTTGAVALELGRRAILIELNPSYAALIEQRCNITLGLALA